MIRYSDVKGLGLKNMQNAALIVVDLVLDFNTMMFSRRKKIRRRKKPRRLAKAVCGPDG